MSFKDILKSSLVGDLFIRRTPPLYGRHRARFASFDGLDAKGRREVQESLTNRTLAQAATTDYARARGLGGSLDRWPLLEKETLRDSGDSLLRRGLLPSHRAETGGTTGLPVAVMRSWPSVVFEQAALDHLVACHAGLDWRRARTAVLRGDSLQDPSDMTPPFWRLHRGGRVLAMSSQHLAAQTVAAYTEALKDFQPQVLWAYPSALEAICRLAEAGSLAVPGLQLVLCSSEVLSPEVRDLAKTTFHAPVLDYYGQAERVALSHATDASGCFFVFGYGRVELLHVGDDEDCARYDIVGTSYWNSAQPLVRYRTGDVAKLPKGLTTSEVDDVCLGLRPFLGVGGRASDFIISPEGARLVALDHIPRGVPHIAQMQIVQKASDRLELHIVPLPGFSDATVAHLLANARKKIPQSMAVEVITVDRLQRSSRGKTPYIIRKPAT